jgi:uncharacterized protein
MRTMVAWLSLGAATVAVAVALSAIGLPSSTLSGALLIGLAVALARPGRLAVLEPAFVAAQAIVGVTMGGYLQASSLSAVAGDWLPVTLVSAATLAVSPARRRRAVAGDRRRPLERGAGDGRGRGDRHGHDGRRPRR